MSLPRLLLLFLFLLLLSCSSESEKEVYRITITAVPEESGSVTPADAQFEAGRLIEIGATPAEHWLFDRWEGDHEGTDNPVVITLDADKQIAAFFVQREYPLTIRVTGEGTVSERIVQARSAEYPQGTAVELTATPAQNWEFTRWEGDLDGNANPAVITVDGETNVTAVFSLIEYPLTVTITGNGRVDEEVVQAKTTGYTAGTSVQLTAVPDENWMFTGWNGDLDGDENPAVILVDGPKEVSAVFQRTFRLTTLVEPEEEAGTITPDAGDYLRDVSFEVEATAGTGWEFVRWEGDFTGSVNPFNLTMNGNKTIVAQFRRLAFVLTANTEGQGDIQIALLSGAERDNGFEFGSVAELTAVPNTGWQFVRWEGDLSGNENPASVTMDGDKSVKAIFTFFEGGSGTPDDPYQVINFSQLNEVRNYPDAHFILINHIDAAGSAGSDQGLGFIPIGNEDAPFTGTLNGNGYSISNLTINRPSANHVGFFGYLDGSAVNVTLTDVTITGDEKTGGIAGLNRGRIEDSRVTGTITGDSKTGGAAGVNAGVIHRTVTDVSVMADNAAGGLAGLNENEITDSHASGTVTGISFKTGGLTGENTGLIERSSASVNVSGKDYTGGLTGWNRFNAEIRESFASGDVTGNERVGGLAGRNDGGNPVIIRSYAAGSVTGSEAVGGLVGTAGSGSTIRESYAAGVVTGADETGGFIGRNSTEISLSYWDREKSGQDNGSGLGSDAGLTGLLTEEMTGTAAEVFMDGFDWAGTWFIVTDPDGYPILWWQAE